MDRGCSVGTEVYERDFSRAEAIAHAKHVTPSCLTRSNVQHQRRGNNTHDCNKWTIAT
jgi:hypothetical protein